MQTYDVYRVDYVKHHKVPMGKVVERRNRKRPDNILGLLRVARKTFGWNPDYDMHIVLDKNALK